MSIFAEQTIDLNLTPGGVLPVVHVSQYDSGYQINFRIFDGSQRYDIPTDVTVRLDMTKTDGQGVSVQATKNNSIPSMCYVWLITQMTTCTGDNECELVFVHRDDARRIGSVNFILQVEQAGLRRDAIVSESQISIVQNKLDEWGSVAAYGDALDSINGEIEDLNILLTTKAPESHTDTEGRYGLATEYSYGHIKHWTSATTRPTGSGPYAMDPGTVIDLRESLQPETFTASGGWVWGDTFDSALSVCYCRRISNLVQLTFAAQVKGDKTVPAATSRNIITNLPKALTRIYCQATLVTYTNNAPSAAVPIMCAIRPEETASNSNRILKVDGATNPTAVGAGQTIFGTIIYISNDWAI